MSSTDGSDGGTHLSPPAAGPPGQDVNALLVEALIHVLIEKGLLTRNDALGVVETAAQVKRGEWAAVDDAGVTSLQTAAALKYLRRLYVSFEALEERPGVDSFDGDNVHRLRPPLHGDRPEFPRDD